MATPPRPDAWIARERTGAPTPAWFMAGAAGIAALVTAVLVALGVAAGAANAAEQRLFGPRAGGPVLLQALYPELGLAGARVVSAVATGLAVAATAAVGHRLFRQPAVGLIAAALVAADPSVLAFGHRAGPMPLVMAVCLGSLACFLSTRRALHWCGAFLVFLATFIHPALAVWSLALLLLRFLRGHIYAAPKHLGLALLQTVVPAALGALLAWAAVDGPAEGLPACTLGGFGALILTTVPRLGGTQVAIPNVAVWFGGLAALATFLAGALWMGLGRFRIHRMPGRLHLRLPRRLDRPQARALWMGLLIVAMPVPQLWLPVLAVALAAAVVQLARDSPGFGLLVGALLFGFAVLYTVRVWGLVTGTASSAEAEELLALIPWLRGAECG